MQKIKVQTITYINLNTSYVKVQYNFYEPEHHRKVDLNTSYVKVQLSQKPVRF